MQRIQVLLVESDAEKLKALADENSLTVSAYLRMWLHKELNK